MQKNEYLKTLSLLNKKVFRRGINYSLDRLSTALNELGNPHKSLSNIIHVAGTNGKGSTLGYIAENLRNSGYRVGTFISPHIKSYRERITVNNEPISHKDFTTLFHSVNKIKSATVLSEFEILFLMMLLHFKESKPDIICLETGLGGRLDATNVVIPLLTVITKIDMDHQNILGDTITDIAYEKAGIIKPKTPLITTKSQHIEVQSILTKVADKLGSPIYWSEPLSTDKSTTSYQSQNFSLACLALTVLKELGFKNINAVKPLLPSLHWGRLTQYKRANQTLLLDGAHNLSGIKELTRHIDETFKNKNLRVVFGVMNKKDWKSMINQLNLITSKIDYCPFDPINSVSYNEMKAYCLSKNIECHLYNLDSPLPLDKLIIFTGSLYFLSELKKTYSL